jgi:uncharacterized phage protein (predicted DNA packaging)
MYVALDKIKTHLNIDKDFVEDDNYLMSVSEVAECVVERHIGYKFSKLMEDNDGQLPMPIQHAMLLFIGTMYANRESVTFGSANVLPHAYDYILQLFENYDVWC